MTDLFGKITNPKGVDARAFAALQETRRTDIKDKAQLSIFDALDKDKDGILTQAEIQSFTDSANSTDVKNKGGGVNNSNVTWDEAEKHFAEYATKSSDSPLKAEENGQVSYTDENGVQKVLTADDMQLFLDAYGKHSTIENTQVAQGADTTVQASEIRENIEDNKPVVKTVTEPSGRKISITYDSAISEANEMPQSMDIDVYGNGAVNAHYIYMFDDNGDLTPKLLSRTEMKGEIQFKTTYEYNSDGTVIARSEDPTKGTVTMRTLTDVSQENDNIKGNLKSEIITNKQTGTTITSRYKSDGKTLASRVTESSTTTVTEAVANNGVWTKETYYKDKDVTIGEQKNMKWVTCKDGNSYPLNKDGSYGFVVKAGETAAQFTARTGIPTKGPLQAGQVITLKQEQVVNIASSNKAEVAFDQDKKYEIAQGNKAELQRVDNFINERSIAVKLPVDKQCESYEDLAKYILELNGKENDINLTKAMANELKIKNPGLKFPTRRGTEVWYPMTKEQRANAHTRGAMVDLNIISDKKMNAENSFHQQLNKDGICADIADTFGYINVFNGAKNTAGAVRKDFKELNDGLQAMKTAIENNDYEGFTKAFKATYGVEYNHGAIMEYKNNPTEANLRAAFGTKRISDMNTRVEDYNKSQDTGAEIVKDGATAIALCINPATGALVHLALDEAESLSAGISTGDTNFINNFKNTITFEKQSKFIIKAGIVYLGGKSASLISNKITSKMGEKTIQKMIDSGDMVIDSKGRMWVSEAGLEVARKGYTTTIAKIASKTSGELADNVVNASGAASTESAKFTNELAKNAGESLASEIVEYGFKSLF